MNSIPEDLHPDGGSICTEAAEAMLAGFDTALRAGDSNAARNFLEALLRDHAEPIIRRVTRRKLFSRSSREGSYGMHDEEDVRGAAMLQLISRLHTPGPGAAPIENFEAYVVGIVRNCCNQLLRQKYPQYWRLKNRLRYLFNHRPQLALWKDEANVWLCGLTAWKHTRRLGREPGDLKEFIGSVSGGRSIAQIRLDDLVPALLSWRGRPMAFEELVKSAADLYGIRDHEPDIPLHGQDGSNLADLLPDASADVISVLDARTSLERLWREISELPRPQRVALLLNLRDSQKRSVLTLLPLTAIASLRDIAGVLDIPVQQFTSLWSLLPLDDLSIGKLLLLSRQQVINLRKSARERLARRMVSWRATAEDR